MTRSPEPTDKLDAATSVRSTSGERAVEVQRAVQQLDRELAAADMSAYASSGADGAS